MQQCKNISAKKQTTYETTTKSVISSKGNMFSPKHSNPTTLATEKCNIFETQDKNFKMSTMNMFKELKVDEKKNPL